MRVLLVEDDRAISALLQRYLIRNQHQVSVFESSPEALAAFQQNPDQFDVAVTDLGLKDISGEELVLKFLELRPNVPMVIATGYSYTADHLPPRARAQIRVLLKPFLPQQMLEILSAISLQREALDLESKAISAEAPPAPAQGIVNPLRKRRSVDRI